MKISTFVIVMLLVVVTGLLASAAFDSFQAIYENRPKMKYADFGFQMYVDEGEKLVLKHSRVTVKYDNAYAFDSPNGEQEFCVDNDTFNCHTIITGDVTIEPQGIVDVYGVANTAEFYQSEVDFDNSASTRKVVAGLFFAMTLISLAVTVLAILTFFNLSVKGED